jgi:hypothetical protein
VDGEMVSVCRYGYRANAGDPDDGRKRRLWEALHARLDPVAMTRLEFGVGEAAVGRRLLDGLPPPWRLT